MCSKGCIFLGLIFWKLLGQLPKFIYECRLSGSLFLDHSDLGDGLSSHNSWGNSSQVWGMQTGHDWAVDDAGPDAQGDGLNVGAGHVVSLEGLGDGDSGVDQGRGGVDHSWGSMVHSWGNSWQGWGGSVDSWGSQSGGSHNWGSHSRGSHNGGSLNDSWGSLDDSWGGSGHSGVDVGGVHGGAGGQGVGWAGKGQGGAQRGDTSQEELRVSLGLSLGLALDQLAPVGQDLGLLGEGQLLGGGVGRGNGAVGVEDSSKDSVGHGQVEGTPVLRLSGALAPPGTDMGDTICGGDGVDEAVLVDVLGESVEGNLGGVDQGDGAGHLQALGSGGGGNGGGEGGGGDERLHF